MKSRAFLTITGVFLAVILLTGACSTGFIVGRALPASVSQPLSLFPDLPFGLSSSSPTQEASPEELEDLFVPFWQAWDLIHEQYVDQPVDDEALMRGAIEGMLDSLGDPHTSYLDPEQYEMLTSQLQGEESYEGIGAWVDTSSDYLTIISPMPGSPAEEAGLRPGDKIIAINGEDMTGIDGEVVRKQVLGPSGTTVRLTILRAGMEPFDVEVTRASISVPSLESRMLENDIAYIHLFLFGDKTRDELREALTELEAQNPQGLILDLRFNGGGFLEAAVDVASEFISEGVILYEEYGDGTRTTFHARQDGLATDIPLVVLINEGSASASEIVAGAIQDHERGIIIGTNSFGKGSVQIPTTLRDNAGAVRITVARWLTPNERTIHEIGLKPDIIVEITEEDIEANRDPQLDRAIEYLKDIK